jgi:WD40 repeat protein
VRFCNFNGLETQGIPFQTMKEIKLDFISQIFSCSSDSSVAVFDIASGQRVKKYRGHQSIVNSLSTSRRGQEMICSVSDDGFTKIWDTRTKDAVKSFDGKYPLLATAFSRDGGLVFSAGIANDISVWLKTINLTKSTGMGSSSRCYSIFLKGTF